MAHSVGPGGILSEWFTSCITPEHEPENKVLLDRGVLATLFCLSSEGGLEQQDVIEAIEGEMKYVLEQTKNDQIHPNVSVHFPEVTLQLDALRTEVLTHWNTSHTRGNPFFSTPIEDKPRFALLALNSIVSNIHFANDLPDDITICANPAHPAHTKESAAVSKLIGDRCAEILYKIYKKGHENEIRKQQLQPDSVTLSQDDFLKMLKTKLSSARVRALAGVASVTGTAGASGQASIPASTRASTPAAVQTPEPTQEVHAKDAPLADLEAELAALKATDQADQEVAKSANAATDLAAAESLKTNQISAATATITTVSAITNKASTAAAAARNAALEAFKEALKKSGATQDEQIKAIEVAQKKAKTATVEARSKAKDARIFAVEACRLAEEIVKEANKDKLVNIVNVRSAARKRSFEATESAESAEESLKQAEIFADLATKMVQLRNNLAMLSTSSGRFDLNIVEAKAAAGKSIKDLERSRLPVIDSLESVQWNMREKIDTLKLAKDEVDEAVTKARGALSELAPVFQLELDVRTAIQKETAGLSGGEVTSLLQALSAQMVGTDEKLKSAKEIYLHAMALKACADNLELIDFVAPTILDRAWMEHQPQLEIELVKVLQGYDVTAGLFGDHADTQEVITLKFNEKVETANSANAPGPKEISTSLTLPRNLTHAKTAEEKIRLFALLLFKAKDISNQSIIQLRWKRNPEAEVLDSPILIDHKNGEKTEHPIHSLKDIRDTSDFNRLSKEDKKLVYAQIEALQTISREIMQLMKGVKQSLDSGDAGSSDAKFGAWRLLIKDDLKFRACMRETLAVNSLVEKDNSPHITEIIQRLNERISFDSHDVNPEMDWPVSHLRGLADGLSYRALFKTYAGFSLGVLDIPAYALNYKRKADGNNKSNRIDMVRRRLLEVAHQIEPDLIRPARMLSDNKIYLRNFIEKLVIAPRERLGKLAAEGGGAALKAIHLERAKLEWSIQAKRNKSRKINLFGNDRMGAVIQADLELVTRSQLTLQTLLGTLPKPKVEGATLAEGFNPDHFANVWLDINNSTQPEELGGLDSESKRELKRVLDDLKDLIFPIPEQKSASLLRPDEARLNRHNDKFPIGSIAEKALEAFAEFDLSSGKDRDEDLVRKKKMLSAAMTEVLGALVVPLRVRERANEPISLGIGPVLQVPLSVPWFGVNVARRKKVDKGLFDGLLKTAKVNKALTTVREVWIKVVKEVVDDDIKNLVAEQIGSQSNELSTLIETSKVPNTAKAGDREKLIGILQQAIFKLQTRDEAPHMVLRLTNASKQLQAVFDLEANLMGLVDLKTRMNVAETEGKLTMSGVTLKAFSKNTAYNAGRSAQNFE